MNEQTSNQTDEPTSPSDRRKGGRGTRTLAWVFGNATTLGTCRIALLVLRVMTGVIFAYHGGQKGFGSFGGGGWEATIGTVEKTGLAGPPVLWAVLLVVAELVGGIGLVLGFATRIWAVMTAVVMIVALTTVHAGDPFAQVHTQQMLLIASLVLLLAGGGALSLYPGTRRP